MTAKSPAPPTRGEHQLTPAAVLIRPSSAEESTHGRAVETDMGTPATENGSAGCALPKPGPLSEPGRGAHEQMGGKGKQV